MRLHLGFRTSLIAAAAAGLLAFTPAASAHGRHGGHGWHGQAGHHRHHHRPRHHRHHGHFDLSVHGPHVGFSFSYGHGGGHYRPYVHHRRHAVPYRVPHHRRYARPRCGY